MFKIFPATITRDGVKTPIIENWYDLATTDPAQIQEWQITYGNRILLWGIPCGSANGIIGVDIDVKKIDGFESARQHNLNLPHTLSQTTMTGGKHYIYKLPQGMIIGNTVGTFAPAVDTRGEKGWLAYYGLDNTPIADAPEWLLKPKVEVIRERGEPFTIAPKLAQEMLDEICLDVANAPSGESNNVLNVKAFEAGQNLISTNSFARDHVYSQLFAAAKLRGKSDSEAKATINSGIDGGIKAGPSIVVPFKPCPVVNVPTHRERWTPPDMTLDQMRDRSKSFKRKLYKGWTTADIHLVTADGGTGKTTLALYEAVCMALGQRFLGFEIDEPGKTLFLTGEDDAQKLISQTGDICREMMLTDDQWMIVSKSIKIKCDNDLCFISKDRSGFLQPNMLAFEKIKEAIDDFKPDKIVIDPIASFWGSEALLNDMAKAVTKFMGLIRNYGDCCVEALNHMGKSSSQSKDITQFAGRGGSALPSHSRVSKVYRKLSPDEYTEMTGKSFNVGESAFIVVINKFTDSSPRLDKPFVVLRIGTLFEIAEANNITIEDEEDSVMDIERVHSLIKEERAAGKYPTRSYVIAVMRQYMSKDKASGALSILQFKGFAENKILYVQHPDLTIKERAIVLTDLSENEL